MAATSPPPQNSLPSPVIVTQRTAASWSQRIAARSRAWASGRLIVLPASGRFSRISATPSSICKRTGSSLIPEPPRRCLGSLRRHSHGSVEADHAAVQHRVAEDGLDQLGELLGL